MSEFMRDCAKHPPVRHLDFTEDEIDERDWTHLALGFIIGAFGVALAWFLASLGI